MLYTIRHALRVFLDLGHLHLSIGGLGMQGGKAWVRRAYSVALTGCGTASCLCCGIGYWPFLDSNVSYIMFVDAAFRRPYLQYPPICMKTHFPGLVFFSIRRPWHRPRYVKPHAPRTGYANTARIGLSF